MRQRERERKTSETDRQTDRQTDNVGDKKKKIQRVKLTKYRYMISVYSKRYMYGQRT